MKCLKKYSLFVLLGCVFIFTGAVIFGGRSLKSITVTYIGEGKEHQDKFVPGINSDERPPDYGLEVRFDNEWRLLGLFSNTFIASNPLSFMPNKQIPVRLAEEIRLFDDDPLENDILEVHTLKEGKIQGDRYSFEVEFGYSLLAGLEYFWHTAVGKAILAGITVCVILFLLSATVL